MTTDEQEPKPLHELTDAELRALGGSGPAAELERRAHERALAGVRRGPEPSERDLVRAHTRGPRDLENAWERMARSDAEAAEITSTYWSTLRRNGEALDRTVERAQLAIAADHARSAATAASPPVTGTRQRPGGWEQIASRAHAAQAAAVTGERNRLWDHIDPDDVKGENRRYGVATNVGTAPRGR